MALEYATEADIPEASRDQYDSYAPDLEKPDQLVWIDKDLKASKLENFKMQGNLTSLTDQMNGFKASQAEAAAKIKADTEAEFTKTITDLKAQGKEAEANKIEMEQLQSQLTQQGAQQAELQSKYDTQQSAIIEGKKDSIAQSLAVKFAAPELVDAVTQLIKTSRTKEVDGVIHLLDKDGKAVKFDETSYLAAMNSDPLLAALAQKANTTNGLNAQGNNGPSNNGNMTAEEIEIAEVSKNIGL